MAPRRARTTVQLYVDLDPSWASVLDDLARELGLSRAIAARLLLLRELRLLNGDPITPLPIPIAHGTEHSKPSTPATRRRKSQPPQDT